MGNTIANGNDGSVRVNMNFERLYNKSKFLASINRGKSTNKKVRNTSQPRDPKAQGQKKKREKSVEASTAARIFIRPLMAVRRFQFNYAETNSSFVPGINKIPTFMGLSDGFEAPGWKYIGGFAPDDDWLLSNADADNPEDGYFVNHDCVNQQFARTYSERWDAKLTLEPFRDFNIDVTIDRNFTQSETSLFKFRPEDGEFNFGDWSEYGTYRITYLTTKTLFKDGETNINALFETFKGNLQTLSARVNAESPKPSDEEHPEYSGYAFGYGLGQQEIIVPAFISAYRDEDPNSTELNIFDVMPLPNWTLTYNGLTKIPWFKERFTRFSLSHNYQSTLTVNSFNTDLRYFQDDPQSEENINPITKDYYSRITIPQLVIAESMSPIVKVDITTVNDLTFNFEVGKNRNLALDPDNQQINETRGTSWAVGFGYTLKNIYLGFIPGAKKPRNRPQSRGTNTQGQGGNADFAGNTLRISCDVSVKDDRTIQHLWGLDVTARPTRGQKAVSINPALDYTVNEYLTVRLFADYRSTEPYTNLSYPITNIRGGLRLRFSLR